MEPKTLTPQNENVSCDFAPSPTVNGVWQNVPGLRVLIDSNLPNDTEANVNLNFTGAAYVHRDASQNVTTTGETSFRVWYNGAIVNDQNGDPLIGTGKDGASVQLQANGITLQLQTPPRAVRVQWRAKDAFESEMPTSATGTLSLVALDWGS